MESEITIDNDQDISDQESILSLQEEQNSVKNSPQQQNLSP